MPDNYLSKHSSDVCINVRDGVIFKEPPTPINFKSRSRAITPPISILSFFKPCDREIDNVNRKIEDREIIPSQHVSMPELIVPQLGGHCDNREDQENEVNFIDMVSNCTGKRNSIDKNKTNSKMKSKK